PPAVPGEPWPATAAQQPTPPAAPSAPPTPAAESRPGRPVLPLQASSSTNSQDSATKREERSPAELSSAADRTSANNDSKSQPKTAREYEQQGRQFAADGRLKGSVDALNHAIQLSPRSAKAYNARGYSYLRMRDYN